MKTYSGLINKLEPNQIFVCGTNRQGRWGKGAALWARLNAGARNGKPVGTNGNAYGIVTKDLSKVIHPSISREYIIQQITDLYFVATLYPQYEYLIAYNGKGTNLNGYSNEQMAEMFGVSDIPDNIVFEEEFAKMITKYQHGKV